MRLAFDTVANYCSVAVADDKGAPLASCHEYQERGHAESLLPFIKQLIRKAQMDVTSLSAIVVTKGPGTFAGVRIGVAAAKGLAFASGAKVLGLTTFESLMGLAWLQYGSSLPPLILIILPGRASEQMVQVFKKAETKTPPWESMCAPRNLKTLNIRALLRGKSALLYGPTVQTLKYSWVNKKISLENSKLRAQDLLRMARFFTSSHWGSSVSPFYMRAPDARPNPTIAAR